MVVADLNPYVGPRPFEERDGHLFFGREREAQDLVSLVVAHAEVLLYAQSGAGKTSILNAKIIPLLRREGFELFAPARVRSPTAGTFTNGTANIYVQNMLLFWIDDGEPPERLSQLSLSDFLAERPHRTDEYGLPLPRVLLIDQFEEIFTFYPDRWPERADFFGQINAALRADSLLRVVFVIREDFLAEFDSYSILLPRGARARLRLERLRERSALAAITGPLQGTGRAFLPGVAEQLVEQLCSVSIPAPDGGFTTAPGEFAEPAQLQAVCQRLWQELPADVTLITGEELKAFGDIREVLIEFYERALSRACKLSGMKEGELRHWFENALITEEGTRGTVIRGRKSTGGIPNAVIILLEDERLIRGEWRGNAHWYELSHDRFIEAIRASNQSRKLRFYRQALQLTGAILFTATTIAAIIFSLLPWEWNRKPEESWGIPEDFPAYDEQLQELAIVCMVDNLLWLPRKLISLSANCERIVSLDGIPPNLRHLDISGTRIEDLKNLPSSVVSLDVSGTLISDFSGLSNVEHLNAFGIRISDMRLLPRSLKILKLQHPDIDNLEGLPGGLTELELNGTSVRSLEDLPSSIRRLTLSSNSLLDLASLPSRLEELSVDSSLRSVDIPASLQALALRNTILLEVPNVRSLELSRALVGRPLPFRLVQLRVNDRSSTIPLENLPEGLKSLKMIWPTSASFAMLPKGLRYLDLSGSEDLTSIAGIGDIDNLNISRTAIRDLQDVPDSVVSLHFEFCNSSSLAKFPKRLSSLYLGGCVNLKTIENLPETLKDLHLQKVPISSLKNLPSNLLRLDISNTNIQGNITDLPGTLEELTLHVGQVEGFTTFPPSLRKLTFVYREVK